MSRSSYRILYLNQSFISSIGNGLRSNRTSARASRLEICRAADSRSVIAARSSSDARCEIAATRSSIVRNPNLASTSTARAVEIEARKFSSAWCLVRLVLSQS